MAGIDASIYNNLNPPPNPAQAYGNAVGVAQGLQGLQRGQIGLQTDQVNLGIAQQALQQGKMDTTVKRLGILNQALQPLLSDPNTDPKAIRARTAQLSADYPDLYSSFDMGAALRDLPAETGDASTDSANAQKWLKVHAFNNDYAVKTIGGFLDPRTMNYGLSPEALNQQITLTGPNGQPITTTFGTFLDNQYGRNSYVNGQFVPNMPMPGQVPNAGAPQPGPSMMPGQIDRRNMPATGTPAPDYNVLPQPRQPVAAPAMQPPNTIQNSPMPPQQPQTTAQPIPQPMQGSPAPQIQVAQAQQPGAVNAWVGPRGDFGELKTFGSGVQQSIGVNAQAASQYMGTAQNLETLLDEVETGPAAKYLSYLGRPINEIAAMMSRDGVNPEWIAKVESIQEQSTRLAQQFAPSMGAVTNEKLLSAANGSPQLDLSTQGNRRIVSIIKGIGAAQIAKQKMWGEWIKSHGMQDANQFESDWNKHYMQQAFQFDAGTPKQRGQIIRDLQPDPKAAPTPAYKRFVASVQWMRDNGLDTGTDQGNGQQEQQ